ncbi:hypothetical protein BH23PAT1_BH23PAT1_4430 [soil metagenome]
MKKQRESSTILGCFTPPVMIATFLIEIFLAIYVLVRYKLSVRTSVIAAILICLAGFQLAEFYVCTQSDGAYIAARAGYVFITLLPALGLYLMSLLTKPLSRKATVSLLASTVLIASYFLLAPRAFDGYECTGNYVIFQIGALPVLFYSVFYFGVILLSILRGLRFVSANPKGMKAKAVRWLLAGYAAFIMPVAVIVIIQPEIIRALPSVLCGFAVALALILGLRVAPGILRKK